MIGKSLLILALIATTHFDSAIPLDRAVWELLRRGHYCGGIPRHELRHEYTAYLPSRFTGGWRKVDFYTCSRCRERWTRYDDHRRGWHEWVRQPDGD